MERVEALKVLKDIETKLSEQYEKIESLKFINSEKVLDAFSKANIQLPCMACSSGYGYEDLGKGALSRLYKEIFKAEDAIVAPQITCGTHALTLPLFGILRPGDVAVSITGKPYDTMEDIINGKKDEPIGSLKEFNISFKYVEMNGNDIDIKASLEAIRKYKPKMVYIQRSRGYSSREALSVYDIGNAIKEIKKEFPSIIAMVDNCYGEFTEDKEPIEVGADIIAGSLMKNPGGGVAPTGGYVAGRKDLVMLSASRLTAPSLGIEVGSYNASYYPFFLGIFMSPHVVGEALKGNILLGKVLERYNLESTPKPPKIPHDIVRSIIFRDENKLIEFCRLVQNLSPIDSTATPVPWDMPGYKDKVIMAGGTFIQGSTMELSCDGPIREPYICYIQGGLTYEQVKLLCLNYLMKN